MNTKKEIQDFVNVVEQFGLVDAICDEGIMPPEKLQPAADQLFAAYNRIHKEYRTLLRSFKV